MPVAVAFLIDLVITVVFAAIGRRNHGETSALVGVFQTAWPFLVGAVVGWLILTLTKRVNRGAAVTSGVIVWISTVVVGMLLRQLTGHGTATAFIIVATLFTGALMLGWRAIAAFATRRTR